MFQSNIRMACNLGYLTNGLPENETKCEGKCQADSFIRKCGKFH